MRRKASAAVVFVLCGACFFGTVLWVLGTVGHAVTGVEIT